MGIDGLRMHFDEVVEAQEEEEEREKLTKARSSTNAAHIHEYTHRSQQYVGTCAALYS